MSGCSYQSKRPQGHEQYITNRLADSFFAIDWFFNQWFIQETIVKTNGGHYWQRCYIRFFYFKPICLYAGKKRQYTYCPLL
ncbi:MAG: hypothetical protein RL172_2213 [Bacteroidota bacterium]